LGGLVVEVIHLVGHTEGSIGFLDITNKRLFSGDALGSGNCLMMFTRLPLESLLGTLRHLEANKDRWTEIWVGHFNQCNKVVGMDYVLKLKELVEGIVRGTPISPPEPDLACRLRFKLPFDPYVAKNGDVKVTYNPRKIHYV
jgi:glyoxylase-like metal-dependent hydrolase (beta-lactamase superfamily II)